MATSHGELHHVEDGHPGVTDPPGELMYRLMSRVGSSAASNRICAHSRLAMSSSTWVPRKMMRSRRRRSNRVGQVQPRPRPNSCACAPRVKAGCVDGRLTPVPTPTCRDVTVMHGVPNDTSQSGVFVSATRALLRSEQNSRCRDIRHRLSETISTAPFSSRRADQLS